MKVRNAPAVLAFVHLKFQVDLERAETFKQVHKNS